MNAKPDDLIERLEPTGGGLVSFWARSLSAVALLWSLFQLWIASPLPFMAGVGIFTDIPARGLHLAFGLLLCFLVFPFRRGAARTRVPVHDVALAAAAFCCAAYLWLGYDGITRRDGILLEVEVGGTALPVEAILGGAGILLLLEATRRSVGWPLVVVCTVFIFYSLAGQSMPGLISHKGVSLERLIGYQWLTGEAIFGIPINVSVSYVFLFVLFGAFMDRAGAGRYFLDLAFALVGKYRGGPAKGAILASGMTGMVSGSSIANTVTTGAFTIPMMKRMGFSPVKAGAIEVSASTNGQIMPPIMGAAAFVIAEFIGISYYDVIVHAAIPAAISYCALFYISHLEALKLGLSGLPKAQLPLLKATFLSGLHYLIPILALVYLLVVERWSPASAVFYSILLMMAIILVKSARDAGDPLTGLKNGIGVIHAALTAGARNMISVTAATGAAGLIVGVVSATGLNNAMLGLIEAISQGNVYILLLLTALVCIVLGMGLPTTANYIVVASLMAGVIVELGNASGLILPLIGVHLFVFYFGLMADSTPPVCLAAFAASAISGADPLKTGVQSFLYDIRTAILPLVFIFNPALLLVGVDSFGEGLLVFAVSLTAILCFSALTQWWLLVRLRLWEGGALAVAILCLFRPDFVLNQVSPDFAPLEIRALEAVPAAAEPGTKMRIRVVRPTEYGDRFKMFVIDAPPGPQGRPLAARFGLSLAPAGDDGFEIADVAFMGPAEKAGLAFGDVVTGVEVERLGRPAKEVVYPLGLAALALALLSQIRRRRRAG